MPKSTPSALEDTKPDSARGDGGWRASVEARIGELEKKVGALEDEVGDLTDSVKDLEAQAGLD